jgi:hypothetical protein
MAIELTGKRYKALQLIGIIGMIVGLIIAMLGGGIYAAILMAVSLGVFVAGRYGAWWHHG